MDVKKGLKLKVRRFLGLIPTFVEVTEGKLVGGSYYLFHIKSPNHLMMGMT